MKFKILIKIKQIIQHKIFLKVFLPPNKLSNKSPVIKIKVKNYLVLQVRKTAIHMLIEKISKKRYRLILKTR